MGNESRYISREELGGFIEGAAEQEAYKIDDAARAIINEVVASFPESEKKNAASVGKWCNSKVEEILSSRPELKDQAEKIRQRVRMELVYLLNQEDFNNLKQTIDELKPEKVTPIWIRRNVKKVAGLVNGNRLSWDLVSEKLGIAIEQRPTSFEEIMNRVNAHFRSANPKVISPGYIQDNLPADYLYFRRNILDTQGMVDWDRILANIDPDFQNRWKKLSVYEESKPKETYRSEEEVQGFLEKHASNLFTVVEAKADEREGREEIIQGLVKLAKKGNDAAFEKVFEYLGFIVQSWISEKRLPRSLNDNKERLDERIKRSIYLYRDQGPYLTYLFVSLARLGKGLKEHTVSFNEKIAEHNQPDSNGKRNGKHLVSGNEPRFYNEPDDSVDL